MHPNAARRAVRILRAESAATGLPRAFRTDLDIDEQILLKTNPDAHPLADHLTDKFYWLLRDAGTELYIPVNNLPDPAAALTWTLIAARFWSAHEVTRAYTYTVQQGLRPIPADELIRNIIADAVHCLTPTAINRAITKADEPMRRRQQRQHPTWRITATGNLVRYNDPCAAPLDWN